MSFALTLFGGERGQGGNKEPVNSNVYYETLGIAIDADEKAIRKAYRNLAMKHHPDKGGDAEICRKGYISFL